MASIRQIGNNFKWLLENESYYFGVLLVLVAVLAYGLGRLSVLGVSVTFSGSDQSAGVVLVSDEVVVTDDRLTIPRATATIDTVAGSRNGTRYYRLDCSGVERIAEANRLYFVDAQRAQAAGYTPSVQCFD